MAIPRLRGISRAYGSRIVTVATSQHGRVASNENKLPTGGRVRLINHGGGGILCRYCTALGYTLRCIPPIQC